MKRTVFALILALLLALSAFAGDHDEVIIRGAQDAVPLFTRVGGPITWKCSTGMTCTWANGVFTMTAPPPSGGAVGGASALTTVGAVPMTTSAGVLGEYTDGCPAINSATHLCVTKAPYYASASGTTTTTSGSTAPGTTVTVASCASFNAADAGTRYGHEGVFIAGGYAAVTDFNISSYDTILRSTTRIVSAADIGRVVHVTGGTGFTPGDYAVRDVDVGLNWLYMDRPVGVVGSSGGIGNMDYVGAVSTCVGTAMTVTPATTATVTTGSLVQHDDSAAFNAAITALTTTGGTINIPDGMYNLNGTFISQTQPSILRMPDRTMLGAPTTYSPISIELKGLTPQLSIHWPPQTNVPSTYGAVLKTSRVGYALIGGASSVSGYAGNNYTNVILHLKNLTFRSYDNPNIVLVDGFRLGGLMVENASFDTGVATTIAEPTHSTGVAIASPGGTAFAQNIMRNIWINGMYTAIKADMHAYLDYVNIFSSMNGIVINAGHPLIASRLYFESTPNALSGTGKIYVSQLSGEGCKAEVTWCTGPYWVNDPLNLLYGTVYVESTSLFATGGENLDVHYSNLPPPTKSAVTVGTLTARRIATPGAPTVTKTCPDGACASTWTYKVTALAGDGTTTLQGAAGSTTTQNVTLDSTHYNTITWTAVAGAATYTVWRTVSAGTPATLGKLASCTAVNALSCVDNGLVGDASSAPTANTTGGSALNGKVTIGNATEVANLVLSGKHDGYTYSRVDFTQDDGTGGAGFLYSKNRAGIVVYNTPDFSSFFLPLVVKDSAPTDMMTLNATSVDLTYKLNGVPGGTVPARKDYTLVCQANLTSGTLTSIVVASNAATATCSAPGCGMINGQTAYVIGATSDTDLNAAYVVVSSGITDTTVTFTTANVTDGTYEVGSDAGMSFQGCLLNGASYTGNIAAATTIRPVLFSLLAGSKMIGNTVYWPAAWTGPGTLTGSVGATSGTDDTFYAAASNLMAATGWLDTSSYKSKLHGSADNTVLALVANTNFGDATLPILKLNGSVTVSVTW